jgi:hypothetical protein
MNEIKAHGEHLEAGPWQFQPDSAAHRDEWDVDAH